jgi:hypothetical protein
MIDDPFGTGIGRFAGRDSVEPVFDALRSLPRQRAGSVADDSA